MAKTSTRDPLPEVDESIERFLYTFREYYTGEKTPGEIINFQAFIDTVKLSTQGVETWQGMLKQAIASDALRDLSIGNAHSQTGENGVYKTTANTSELPDTNKVGILEAYNNSTLKYLRYSTFNVGRIEIWTQYFDGSSWSTWNYENGDSSLAFTSGVEESGGVVRIGGTSLDSNRVIPLSTYNLGITGNGEFYVETEDDPYSHTSKFYVSHTNVKAEHEKDGITYEFVLNDNGIGLSHWQKTTNRNSLPSNDTENAVGNTVYITTAETLNMPASGNLVGILEAFDHAESGDVELRYTTYVSGVIEVWGRKKSSSTWYNWIKLEETTTSILTKIGDGSKISSSYLPSYVDDVVEYDDFESFPAEGETGKIYVAKATDAIYRWSGSIYILLANSGSYVFQEGVTESGGVVEIGGVITKTKSVYRTTNYFNYGWSIGTTDVVLGNLNESQGRINISPTSVYMRDANSAHIAVDTGNARVSCGYGYVSEICSQGGADETVKLEIYGAGHPTLAGEARILDKRTNKRGLSDAADYSETKTDLDYATKFMLGSPVREQGDYDASGDAFPSSGGSGTGGAIKKANRWKISVGGVLDTITVSPGQYVEALVDNPGQTALNWHITPIIVSGVVANGAQLLVPSRCNFSVMSYLGYFGLYVNGDSRTVVLGGIGVLEPYPRLDIEETYLLLKGGQNALDFNFRINRYDTNNGDAVVTDGRATPKGIQEAADYSANKTDYCYATKKMVSKICTADFNLQSGESELNNTCIYHKIYVSTGKSVTKAKIMVNGSTTTNDITIKLYDASKNEITNGEATISPSVDSSLHVLEGSFGAGIQLADNTFYWVGIHQASGGGASLVDIANARSNSEWNTGVSGASLAASVPVGTATNIRICVELI